MPWVLLVIAGLFEVVWATALKSSEGFTKLYPTIVTIVAMLISFALLAQAMKTLPLGTAYAVWTGIGAVGGAILGILMFNEPANALRIGCVALIVIGIIGLKVTSTTAG